MPTLNAGNPKPEWMLGSTFTLEIPNVFGGPVMLTEASGMGVEVAVVDANVSAADGRQITHKIPGVVKYNEVTVKRFFDGDKTLWDVMKLITERKRTDLRSAGSIVMYDHSMKEQSRWKFENCWPSKWSLTDLDVGSDDAVTEELVLQIELLIREK